MTGSLLCAYAFTADNQPQSCVPAEGLNALANSGNTFWGHFEVGETSAQLIKDLPIAVPDIAITALMADDTRPRITNFGDSFLLNLRGINLNDQAAPEDMVSIRLWSDGKNLITTRRRRLKAVDDLRASFEEGTGPKSVNECLADLIGNLVNRMEPTVFRLEEELEGLEEQFLDTPDDLDAAELTELRRRVILLRRYMVPQREALTGLVTGTISSIPAPDRVLINESLNRLSLYLENLDALKERAQLIKDEIAAKAADHMNQNTYVLSIIAAVFLPLGFLTGLLGINVGGIPGADNTDAFWIFCGILIVLVALQVIFFRRKKWF
ncbi:zinc transporter ZntB [Kordiimonas sediminis]|uniref:Zinc transporter ZntB n=1 Tax=Kordiimonas sediminis TaxID=1735581 RepID=A0A919E4S8_9PROT|nr:zinc transporter ZntB [Kordiimonas sediminis]GHF13626.1 zinc transporter ZntB [Kordiimonas sediminis]